MRYNNSQDDGAPVRFRMNLLLRAESRWPAAVVYQRRACRRAYWSARTLLRPSPVGPPRYGRQCSPRSSRRSTRQSAPRGDEPLDVAGRAHGELLHAENFARF